MHVFYEPRIRETLSLSSDESKHAVNVLRMANNAELFVNDGQGNLYRCRIVEAHSKKTTLEIVERVPTKTTSRRIHIAVGITRQADRLEWFVEKATEIGVREITLLVTQNTARHKVNVERLNKIAIAALKQSGNVYLPIVSAPTPFKKFVQNPDLSSRPEEGISPLKLICTATQERNLKSVVGEHDNVVALVGPEGDFTDDELRLANENGFIAVALGPNRLRTETAAFVVASSLALL